MSYSENNTFEKILNRCLANERLTDMDKRVGSLIYDTLAPVALELAEAYVKMDILESQTYLLTATGNNLNRRAYDYGIVRNEATYALRIAEFKKYQVDGNGDYVLDENNNKILVDMDIPIGSRFAVPDSDIIFSYVGLVDDSHVIRCEQSGTIGNEHMGTILPLTPIQYLVKSNIVSTYKPSEDEETDDALRQRILDSINYQSFGGNINDYIERVNAIDGTGNTKVFPAWQYNGSVLLSVVDPLYNPITNEFAENLKEQIDPEDNTGQGVGIAPIGHYVTITTPVRVTVDVSLSLELVHGTTINTIQEDVENKIEEYFNSVRHQFAQDVNLALYRARIIDKVLELPSVLNVTDVKFDNEMVDKIYIDEGHIGHQYLPYLGSVTIE